MKRLNKKAIMMEYLIGLIMSLVLIFIAITIVNKLIGDKTENYTESFDKLITKIEGIKEKGAFATDYQTLLMQKESALLIFNSEKGNEDGFYKDGNIHFTYAKDIVSKSTMKNAYIKRPSICNQENLCLCSCLNARTEEIDDDDYNELKKTNIQSKLYPNYEQYKLPEQNKINELICSEIMCQEITDVNLYTPIQNSFLGQFYEVIDTLRQPKEILEPKDYLGQLEETSGEKISDYIYSNGLVILRSNDKKLTANLGYYPLPEGVPLKIGKLSNGDLIICTSENCLEEAEMIITLQEATNKLKYKTIDLFDLTLQNEEIKVEKNLCLKESTTSDEEITKYLELIKQKIGNDETKITIEPFGEIVKLDGVTIAEESEQEKYLLRITSFEQQINLAMLYDCGEKTYSVLQELQIPLAEGFNYENFCGEKMDIILPRIDTGVEKWHNELVKEKKEVCLSFE